MPGRATDARHDILEAAQHITASKGYAAVGITEVLIEAGVPKGSFYHWFPSKDEFGRELVEHYFRGYLASTDRIIAEEGDAGRRLLKYWQAFHAMQSVDECRGRCLVVKLGSEVADLSESMRRALIVGTTAVVDRIERLVVEGVADGSVTVDESPRVVADGLYDLWIGASVLAKVHRRPASLDRALEATVRRLGIVDGGPPSATDA